MGRIEDIYLVAPVRSAIGKFGGTLSPLSAPQLGTAIAKAALERSRVPLAAVDEVIFGHARQAGGGPNSARQIAVRSGLAHEVPAYTVNQACGSGFRSVINAADDIRLGNARVVLAGGVESMSNTPYMVPRARWGFRMGDADLVDGMVRDGFMCPIAEELMGATAENLAERYSISRREQDEYAVESQRRAKRAWDNGWFAGEIVAVEVPGKKEPVRFDRDEHPRFDATVEGLAKLPPVFRENGTVHAGNSSGITDGAAAMIVASGDAVKEYGLKPAAKLRGYAQAGVDPKYMGIGPVPATRKLLERTGMSLSDIDLIELNEAFASQVLACDRELGLDRDKVNVHGGSIALGHPIGCTGSRILATLIHALATHDKSIGMATLCISGGMGISVLVERV
jgi:acetyl-CoA C-acetyltransferase